MPVFGAGAVSGGSAPRKATNYIDWASFLAALTIMYVFFGGYFWGLLEISEAIRGQAYKVLPEKYYGHYVYKSYPAIPKGEASYPVGYDVPWNDTLF